MIEELDAVGAPGVAPDEAPESATAPGPIRLVVERATVDRDGHLEVAGWAVAADPVVIVQVFDGDRRLGAADYGRVRDDIAAIYADYPRAHRSGYVFAAELGDHGAGYPEAIKIEVIAAGGASQSVVAPLVVAAGPRPAPDGREAGQDEAISFHVDVLALTTDGAVTVRGWAVAASRIAAVRVLLDGSEIGQATLGLARPDVGERYSHLPGAGRGGFTFERRQGGDFAGEHRVGLRIIDGDGGSRTADLPVAATEPRSGAEGSPELQLNIDAPTVTNGAVAGVVRGNLKIEGWALARGGVEAVDVSIDGTTYDKAYYGVRREDLAAAFPDWDNAVLAGFAIAIPTRIVSSGRHEVGVELRARSGARMRKQFAVEIEQFAAAYGPGAIRRTMSDAERSSTENILSGLGWHPTIGIVLGIGEIDEEIDAARRTLRSLRDQAYDDWLLLVVRRAGTLPDEFVSRFLDGGDELDRRVIFALDAPPGTALTTLFELSGTSPDLIGVLLGGDMLGCDALLEVAVTTGLQPAIEFLYTDERRRSPATGHLDAFFKPDWSPDLLFATNYIGRFWCAEPALLDRVGATIGDWIRFGDYDLALRCTEAAKAIAHLPRILCQRGRPHFDSPQQERTALERAMRRRGVDGTIGEGCAAGYYRVKRRVQTRGLVSIVIPTCASRGLIKTCIETLRAKTAYRNFEIVCIENIPQGQRRWKRWLRQNADKVIATAEPFNWSRFNNLAAEQAAGEFLLFLNDDTEIIEEDWLDALLEYAERPEIGVVGPRLLYPDRKIQHAGMFWNGAVGRHAFRMAPADEPGYFGLALTPRNVIAVTGACMLVRRRVFEELGRFNEAHNIVNNDVDFCLRCVESNKAVIYTPYATLIHHEFASRFAIADEFDQEGFRRRWGDLLQGGDPYYHPSLSPHHDEYIADPEPLELVYAGHPLFRCDEIRKILVLKLDHIGDFVTAVPALRGLRRYFPKARLSLLGPPANAILSQMVPEIDEVIDFRFFFEKSGLGARELSRDDLSDLHERLAPLGFDLALDLRKMIDTRPVLQFTGARWLAGFDKDNQFPWLDITVEWEGDTKFSRKRAYVGDDFMRLVNAVGLAGTADRRGLSAAAERLRQAHRRPAAAKRLVCVHPGVGNATRQWPAEHFAMLIDLLVSHHDVEVAVIGGPDEAEIADQVIGKVGPSKFVHSLIGKVKLAELPGLLASAALFVGNNSGPKHIAAGLGVPTIGIHSGVVDAREWGPMGVNAVALRRDMHCSPCYLADPADCTRGLACLTQLRPVEVYEVCRRFLAMDPAAITPAR